MREIKKGDAPTTHPPGKFFFSGCSGVQARLKLPSFGSGAVYDSKGHDIFLPGIGHAAANKQGEAFSRKTPPDNCGLKMTPNRYTYFLIHATPATLS
jgi:hypothetical protein